MPVTVDSLKSECRFSEIGMPMTVDSLSSECRFNVVASFIPMHALHGMHRAQVLSGSLTARTKPVSGPDST